MRGIGCFALVAACGGTQTPAPAVGSGEGPLFAPGEAIGYAIRASDGTTIGRAHSKYDESGGKKTIVTRVALPDRTVEYATTLSPDLTPISFKRLSSVDGRMTISFEPNGATRITDLGTDQLPAVNALLIPSDDLVLLALVLSKVSLEPGRSEKLAVLSPDAGSPQDWMIQIYADMERRTIVQLPLGKATLTPRGQIAELTTNDGRSFRRVDPPGEPPQLLPIPQQKQYVRPDHASWVDKELAIPVERGQLAGVLSEPRLRSRWKKNVVPGIVFLSDLPPQNRHGFTGGADYGTWQIFDHLAEQGFAVLRVDDRGVGASRSSIPQEEISIETQVLDALAMIEAMHREPGVDGEKIFLIGHGFGAIDALMVAKTQQLAGLVLIAPPLRTERAKLYAQIDVRALVKEVEEPVAILQGFKDFEVSWRDEAKPLSEAFAKKQAKLFIYEFVDHLLKQESGSSSAARYADGGRKVDAAVLADLVGWLSQKSE